MAAVHHLGSVIPTCGTIREEYFVVLSVVQNLVEIGCVVLKIRELSILGELLGNRVKQKHSATYSFTNAPCCILYRARQ